MADVYSATDLIGKSLFAKKSIPLKRFTDDDKPTVYTVDPGKLVGVVYSWVVKPDGTLWWAFYDQNKNPYYAKHAEGNFSLSELTAQGLESVAQKAKDEAKANESITDKIERNLHWIVIAVVIAFLGKTAIQKAIK
jgi:hypothetical protein